MRLGLTCVYRIYDWQGLLLYVGMTQHVRTRIRQHRGDKPWGYLIYRVAVRTYLTRERAGQVEKRAIILLNPQHNGKPGPQKEQSS